MTRATDYVPAEVLGAIRAWRVADADERRARLTECEDLIIAVGVRVSVARAWLTRYADDLDAWVRDGDTADGLPHPAIEAVQTDRAAWWDRALATRDDPTGPTRTLRAIVLDILTAPTEVPQPFGGA